jgi:hypothetical protein
VTRPQPQVSVFPDDALGDHGVALAALVRSGERSPAELVEAAIARIEAVDSWPACRGPFPVVIWIWGTYESHAL